MGKHSVLATSSKPLVFRVSRSERLLPAPTVQGANGSGVITDPDGGAIIVVPAAAKLQLNEKVQGVLGSLITSIETVTKPNEVLLIPVSAAMLWRLEGEGQLEWYYEIEEATGWKASDKTHVEVAYESSLPWSEPFEKYPEQELRDGQVLEYEVLSLRVRRSERSWLTHQFMKPPPPFGGVYVYFNQSIGGVCEMDFILKRKGRFLEFDLYKWGSGMTRVEYYDSDSSVEPFHVKSIQDPIKSVIPVSYRSDEKVIAWIRISNALRSGDICCDNFRFR
ncbi:hypothetical protein [Pseudomonas sp. PSKL.D1]|uniref:hypothetical protein n=1 Tax=Pseudomonas sp. PSKL.D1 TaxID=3029060 RepID=UPI0023814F13|nr:hypothetical protein [Pseudomonas sp. PSKL.D1]WDY60067.1 hypothetical protein PVV54_10735 [Pseudomonas sp. PSKL.D1]